MFLSENGRKHTGKNEERRQEQEYSLMATHMALYYEEVLEKIRKSRAGCRVTELADAVRKMGIENEGDIQLFGGTARGFIDALIRLGHLKKEGSQVFLQENFQGSRGKSG